MDQIVGQALATFRRIQDGDGRAIDKALLAAE
jgi:hypothetical protein